MKKIEQAIHEMIQNERFFAGMVLSSKIEYDKIKECKTAYASVQNGVQIIGFNTEFVNSLSVPALVQVMKHEVLHMIFNHTNRKLYNVNNQAEKHNWNIAMDCIINQYLEASHLPEGCVTLDSLSKALEKQLEPFQTAQYYYDQIEQAPDHLKQKTEGLETVDDHQSGQEGNQGEQSQSDMQNQINKGIVAKNAQEAAKFAKGLVPEGLVSAISSLKDEAQVNWKSILRNFISNATSNKRISTRKKTNRRFGLQYPGSKKEKKLNLAVCIDTSGSISEEQFTTFITEIKSIHKNCSKVHLIYADCIVQSVIELNENTDVPLERHGQGGTAYSPAIEKAVELKADAILYFGDFDTADKPTDPKKPFLWVGVGNQKPPTNFGKVIYIQGKA